MVETDGGEKIEFGKVGFIFPFTRFKTFAFKSRSDRDLAVIMLVAGTYPPRTCPARAGLASLVRGAVLDPEAQTRRECAEKEFLWRIGRPQLNTLRGH